MLVDAMTVFYPAEDISPFRLSSKSKPPNLADFGPSGSGVLSGQFRYRTKLHQRRGHDPSRLIERLRT